MSGSPFKFAGRPVDPDELVSLTTAAMLAICELAQVPVHRGPAGRCTPKVPGWALLIWKFSAGLSKPERQALLRHVTADLEKRAAVLSLLLLTYPPDEALRVLVQSWAETF